MNFPRYPKYKASGAEWLGEVPGGWSVKPLCALFRRVKRTDRADEQLLSVYRDLGVVPKASRDDNFNKPSEDLSQYQLVEPGDLVINKMKAWQGSVAISDCRGIVSPAYFTYITTHRECGRYLHYLMRSLPYIAWYQTISKGIRINQWDLEPEAHRRTPLLLPPLAEQRAIAAFLDRETKKIDELVAEQERLIELLKEKRQAVISHAVTKGLNPAAPMKPSGVEWLGDVPAHWEILKLGRMGQFRAGAGFPDAYQGQQGNELPFYKVADLSRAELDGSMGESGHTISVELAKELRAVVFEPATIVFAKVGAALLLQRFRWLRHRACIDNNMMGFKGTARVDMRFLLHRLPMLDLSRIANPGAVPSINESQLSELRLAWPPVSEQCVIAAFLDRETAKIDTLVTQAESAISLLTERRSALISAAVTGQIDVRNAVPSANPTEAA